MTTRVEQSNPNLFLVGVPKAATTSMHAWLSTHPDVFMSRLKEPQFFAPDVLGHQRNVVTLEEYQDNFAAAEGQRFIGEASTAYMVSHVAACEIKEFSPNARILIMLRHPVDVMYALHRERMFSGMEHIADFSAAIASSEVRVWRNGRWKGQAIMRPSYREMVDFVPQLERYFATFGRDRVHVEIYDDLVNDPEKVCTSVLSFLGLRPENALAFPRENTARTTRSNELQDLLRKPPSAVRRIASTILPLALRRSVGRRIRRLNARPAIATMDPALRHELQREFASKVARVGALLDRDLSGWITNT